MWVQRMYCQCIANVLQDNGKLLIGTGELFCRVNNGDEDEEVELCGKVCECITNALRIHSDHLQKLSHTGNLRSHVKATHKESLDDVRKGTTSGAETIEIKSK